jgi:hypothetical protein
MLRAQSRLLVALVALVVLVVGALAADKEVTKPLDLSTVKAHDEQKDVSPLVLRLNCTCSLLFCLHFSVLTLAFSRSLTLTHARTRHHFFPRSLFFSLAPSPHPRIWHRHVYADIDTSVCSAGGPAAAQCEHNNVLLAAGPKG